MSMCGCQRVGTGFVHPGGDHERSAVDRAGPFDHIALVVDQDKVGCLDSVERHTKWIDPEILWVFGVAHRDVAGDALGEAELTEESEPGGELLLAVLALRFDRAEGRRLREPASRR